MLHILGHLAGRSLLLHKCQACLCNLQLLQAYKAPLDEIVNPCKWLIFIEIPLSTYLWINSTSFVVTVGVGKTRWKSDSTSKITEVG